MLMMLMDYHCTNLSLVWAQLQGNVLFRSKTPKVQIKTPSQRAITCFIQAAYKFLYLLIQTKLTSVSKENRLNNFAFFFDRTEDFFDSLPAVELAMKSTKQIFYESAEDFDGSLTDFQKKPLRFEEFGVFLKLLHQYYVYCQVSASIFNITFA